MTITSAHGGGGAATAALIREVFQAQFSNDVLDRMEDAAVLPRPDGEIAFTTDSFVVTPLFFPGGDIGKLAVCGTVNDLLMRGARPMYLSAGFILEEGLAVETLRRVARSMREAADEAGVSIVTGDTKVVGGAGGLYINTSGIGAVAPGRDIGAARCRAGDAVIVSGRLGNHQACIWSRRMGIANDIVSDCAPLNDMVANLLDGGIEVHALRDLTRGGLATALNELAAASGVSIGLSRDWVMADEPVAALCDILGLDPMTMANEGKLVLVTPERDAVRALNILRRSRYGGGAQLIGRVHAGEPAVSRTSRG